MTKPDKFHPSRAPLQSKKAFDPLAIGMRTGMLFAAFMLFFALKDGFRAHPGTGYDWMIGVVVIGIAMVAGGRWLAAANSRGWTRLLATACLQGLLLTIVLIGLVFAVGEFEGKVASPSKAVAAASTTLVSFVVMFLVLAVTIRFRITARVGNAASGRDGRNRKPVDAGFDGWVTLDKSKFATYLGSSPPRTIPAGNFVMDEIRTDFGSFTGAFVPIVGLCALGLGIYEGDILGDAFGVVILGFYVRKMLALFGAARIAQLRVGVVKELNERHPKLNTLFVTTAHFEDGGSSQVIVDECLVRALPLANGEIEVAAVCVPKAARAWVISARVPKGSAQRAAGGS